MIEPETANRFFIVDDYDRPEAPSIAEMRDGKLYFIHPDLRDVKEYWGMPPQTTSTPLEDFGIEIYIKSGKFHGNVAAPSRATYRDGKPRKWHGENDFEFDYQNDAQ